MELRKWLYLFAGHVSVAVGVIGIFVPLLPTVPFVLLAAFCYERGSPRFHKMLLENQYFGPHVQRWKEKGAIPVRAKIIAVLMLGASASLLVYLAPLILVKLGVASVAVLISLYIVTRPS